MSTHNIGFYEEISKNISELSSDTHLISSAIYLSIPQTHDDSFSCILWVSALE